MRLKVFQENQDLDEICWVCCRINHEEENGALVGAYTYARDERFLSGARSACAIGDGGASSGARAVDERALGHPTVHVTLPD
jgi:hypothetical protein